MGYKNRKVATVRACCYCGADFTVYKATRIQQANVYCSRDHYLASLSSR